MNTSKYYKNLHLKTGKKQEGATLLTVLVFLVIMTGLGVSASKMAIQDMLVASNDQQQVNEYIRTSNNLKILTTVVSLYQPMMGEGSSGFSEDTGEYTFPSESDGILKKITDMKKRYSCGGVSGLGISIGPSVAPCDLYDFQVRSSQIGVSGARDKHNRGAGKEKPNPTKDSYL